MLVGSGTICQLLPLQCSTTGSGEVGVRDGTPGLHALPPGVVRPTPTFGLLVDDVRAVPTASSTARPAIGEKPGSQHEQPRTRIEVAGIATVERRSVRGEDLSTLRMIEREPRNSRLRQRARRERASRS